MKKIIYILSCLAVLFSGQAIAVGVGGASVSGQSDNLTLPGTLTVGGVATINNDLTVSGTQNNSGAVNVTGTQTNNGAVTVNNDLTVSGTINNTKPCGTDPLLWERGGVNDCYAAVPRQTIVYANTNVACSSFTVAPGVTNDLIVNVIAQAILTTDTAGALYIERSITVKFYYDNACANYSSAIIAYVVDPTGANTAPALLNHQWERTISAPGGIIYYTVDTVNLAASSYINVEPDSYIEYIN